MNVSLKLNILLQLPPGFQRKDLVAELVSVFNASMLGYSGMELCCRTFLCCFNFKKCPVCGHSSLL